eukprot:scaffold58847_cov21-Tisochrysis_lutea.AAC.2
MVALTCCCSSHLGMVGPNLLVGAAAEAELGRDAVLGLEPTQLNVCVCVRVCMCVCARAHAAHPLSP